MAITFLVVTLFFAVAVIKPVHDKFPDSGNDLQPGAYMRASSPTSPTSPLSASSMHFGEDSRTDYLWMYLVFVYLFSALAAYLIVSGTRKVIGIRQEYLGKQTTITDRTFRLSGIPRDMRTEESIKEFVEGLRIGKVSEVCLCKDWHELEAVLASRAAVLRKLEESLTVASNRRTVERNRESLPISQPLPPDLAAEDADDTDSTRLLNGHSDTGEIPDLLCRPTTRLWYGPLKLRSKKVDAIDHYEAQLQALNIKIEDLRHHRYTPSPLAFVTMESVASCVCIIFVVLSCSGN